MMTRWRHWNDSLMVSIVVLEWKKYWKNYDLSNVSKQEIHGNQSFISFDLLSIDNTHEMLSLRYLNQDYAMIEEYVHDVCHLIDVHTDN